jgi:site-specific DNA-cytosine methylase
MTRTRQETEKGKKRNSFKASSRNLMYDEMTGAKYNVSCVTNMAMKPRTATSLREIQREEISPTNQISTTEIMNHEIHRVRHREVTPRHLGRIPTGATETLVSPGKTYREAQIIHTLHRTTNRGYASMEQVFFRDLLPSKQACIQMHRDMTYKLLPCQHI